MKFKRSFWKLLELPRQQGSNCRRNAANNEPLTAEPGAKLRQQAKHNDARPCANVHSPVRNHWGDEMPADRREVVPVRRSLVRVVKFLAKVACVVSEKNPGPPIQRPNNSLRVAVRRDAGHRSVAAEFIRTLRGRRGCQQRLGNWESF